MRITMALTSVGRAFAYLIGIRPRVLIRKYKNLKSNNNVHAKFKNFKMTKALAMRPTRFMLKGMKFDARFFIKSVNDDLTAVLEPVQAGPSVSKFGNIHCKALHRVNVRNVLEAISTTESVEVNELDELNTTHSSFIESELSIAR